MNDTYRTLAAAGEGAYTEKRSRFLAFAFHVENEDEVRETVAAYRRKYYDARHVCYAYVLGTDGAHTRSNDDGEPSGSAGKPILGQLRSIDVTFALVIVVRYFGGVKLGTGGLAAAYKAAAAEALAAATVEERLVKATFRVQVPYADADTAMRFIRESAADITHREYTAADTTLSVSVRRGDEAGLRERLSKIFSLSFPDDAPAAD